MRIDSGHRIGIGLGKNRIESKSAQERERKDVAETDRLNSDPELPDGLQALFVGIVHVAKSANICIFLKKKQRKS